MGGFIWLGKHYLVNWQRPRSPQYSRTKPQRHLQPLHCTPQPICKPHSCGWSGLMKKTIQKSWSPNRTESPRSEERRVGKEWCSTGRSRGSQDNSKKHTKTKKQKKKKKKEQNK